MSQIAQQSPLGDGSGDGSVDGVGRAGECASVSGVGDEEAQAAGGL
uniref:Uncharacterized protein n=1 Tax=Setaria italica TaxID=4555 RepID=K3YNM1_SETIT